MSDIQVNSDLWTGGLPPPRPPKQLSRRQLVIMLLIGGFGVPHSLWSLADGLRTGRLKVPGRHLHGFVTAAGPVGFGLAIIGWLIIAFVAALLVYVSIKELTGSKRR